MPLLQTNLKNEETFLISVAYNLSGVLSCVASITLILILLFQFLKNRKSLKLIPIFFPILLIFLSVTDVMTGFIYGTSWMNDTKLSCEVTGFLRQAAQVASMMCISAIYCSLMLLYSNDMVHQTKKSFQKKITIILLVVPIVCWGSPLVLSIAVYLSIYYFYSNFFGNSGDEFWCWADDPMSEIIFLEVPIIIIFVFSVLMFLFLLQKRKTLNLSYILFDIVWYLVGVLLVWSFPIINSIVIYIQETHYFALDFTCAITLPLSGFINFVIWAVIIRMRKFVHDSKIDMNQFSGIDGNALFDSLSESDGTSGFAKSYCKTLFFGRPVFLSKEDEKGSYYTSEFFTE